MSLLWDTAQKKKVMRTKKTHKEMQGTAQTVELNEVCQLRQRVGKCLQLVVVHCKAQCVRQEQGWVRKGGKQWSSVRVLRRKTSLESVEIWLKPR